MSLYPRIFESPDIIIDNQTDKSYEWFFTGTYAFGYIGDDMLISPESSNHEEIREGFEREDFLYPGRIWTDQKMISFWSYPETKEKLINVLKDLEEVLGIDILNDPDYRIELPAGKRVNGKRNRPLVNIQDYIGGYKRSEEEMKMRHLISPAAGKKSVPAGYGSKHPKYQDRRKWAMASLTSENKEENHYPKLFETPDHMNFNKNEKIRGHNVDQNEDGSNYLWYRSGEYAYSFGYWEGKMYISSNHETHKDINVPGDTYVSRHNLKFSGRIWIDFKVISFWYYPPKEQLPTVLQDLEKIFDKKYDLELNILGNKEWRIDIFDENENETLIPIEKYLGNYKRPEEQLAIQHLIPPGAGKKDVPAGYGSKNPKYQSRRQWQMASITDENMQEEHYPRLFETPDLLDYMGDELHYGTKDAYAFGFYKNKVLISKNTHRDITSDNNIDINYGSSRLVLDYPGRLWKEHKIISFWIYPPVENFKWVIDKISEAIGEDMWRNNWHIEVIVDKTRKNIVDPENHDWYDYYLEKNNLKPIIIPIGNYIGSEKRDEEELKIQHLDMSKKHEVPFGYGSKNPKYQSRRQWQMASVTDENMKDEHYPKLFENPNAIYNPKTRRPEEWNESLTAPFSYLQGKVRLGEPKTTHSDLEDLYAMYEEGGGRGKCSGRLFITHKIITFWHFPKNKAQLKRVLKGIETAIKDERVKEFYDDIIIDFSDPAWRIEVPVGEFNVMKKYPKLDSNKRYPDWGDWEPTSASQQFVSIEDYNDEGYKRHDSELQIRHMIPPAAGKKEVPVGYGSKNPKYQSRRQWQMASVTDENKHEEYYPRLTEAAISKNKQNWDKLYVDYMNSTDKVNPKSFETLRANFGPNDGTAEKKLKDFLHNAAKLPANSFTITQINKGVFDSDAKQQISGEFDSYKVVFNKTVKDVFDNEYHKDSYLFFTNRTKINFKSGDINVIGRKDLTPDKMKLVNDEYENANELLQKVEGYINNTKFPKNYKDFIIRASHEVVNDKINQNKFEDFDAYMKTSDHIIYKIPIELFEGIDQLSINNIQNDYGETLGALMLFNILEDTGKGLRFPTSSNQKLIDFYFDDYKISSKAGAGGTPSGDAMIRAIYDAKENGEVSFEDEDEKDFFDNLISVWINPKQIDPRSSIYNTIISLAAIHSNEDAESGYKFLLNTLKTKDPYVNRKTILDFMDKLVDDEKAFTEFVETFIYKTKFFTGKFEINRYRDDYIQKRDVNNLDRVGLIFYPIVVELVKILNKKFSDILSIYAQKVSDVKQIYLNILIKKGEFDFLAKSFKSSDFIFEQKGSINNPFNANIGIKIKK